MGGVLFEQVQNPLPQLPITGVLSHEGESKHEDSNRHGMIPLSLLQTTPQIITHKAHHRNENRTHIPCVAQKTGLLLEERELSSPGYWSIGDETPVWRLKSHLFHSILSVQFCFFAKLCIQAFLSHTRIFVLSMEMAPSHRDCMVYGYLHCNPMSGYYTSDVRRLRLSSSSCKSPSKPYSYSYYILSLYTDGFIVMPILEETIATPILELDCYVVLKEAVSTIRLPVDPIMKQV